MARDGPARAGGCASCRQAIRKPVCVVHQLGSNVVWYNHSQCAATIANTGQDEKHEMTTSGGPAQYKMRMRYDVASSTKFSKSCAPYRSQQKKGIFGGEARNSGGVFLGQILGHKKGKIPRFARVLSVLAPKLVDCPPQTNRCVIQSHRNILFITKLCHVIYLACCCT